MHTNYARALTAPLAVGAVLTLAGCGGDTGNAGTLTDQEILGHQLRNVAADEAPEVDVDIEADEHGGWNIHLDTEGFEFTPGDVNSEAVGGHGHAHVYVDDTKFSRAYGEWFFLPASAVPAGEHTVMVTLNADDHSAWAVDGEPITATATVTGMTGDGADDHPHDEMDESDEPVSEDTADDSNATADNVFAFAITDGAAEPQLEQHRIERGSTVRIEVTSDVADELHMHGYDVEAEVAAGGTAVLEFTADMVGRFALETHETGLQLLDLLVE